MGWTPEGYLLHVAHTLEERAALLFGRELQKWLDERDWRAEVRVTPMRRDTNERGGTSATMGTLAVVSDVLLTMDAALLRDAVDRLAVEAEEEMKQVIAQELALLEDFMATLKARPED